MKLGKKKSETPPEMNGDSKPAGSSPAGTVTPEKIGLVQALAAILGAALIGLLLDIMVLSPAQQAAESAALEARIESQKRQVEQRLTHFSELVRHFAREPSIIEIVDDEDARRQAADFLAAMLPTVREAHIFPAGNISQPDDLDIPLSFASLDLAQKSQSNNSLLMDAFRRDDQWLFQIAAPMTPVNDGEPRGSALVVLDPSALGAALVQPAGSGGRLSLVQRVGGQDIVVLAQGAGDGETLARDLSFPGWSLRLTASADGPWRADRMLFWSVIAGMGILVAAVIFGLMWWFSRSLNHEAQKLHMWAQKNFSGERTRVPTFALEVIAALGQTLQQLSKAVDKRLVKADAALRDAQKGLASSGHTGQEEPLFQDDNVLDIDMFDGDDDILGLGSNAPAAGPGEITGVGQEAAMTVEVDIPSSIFRAYDIRGIVGETLTPESVRYIGMAIGSEAASRGFSSMCVGYDGRHSSPELAEALTQGLRSTGCDVIDIGRVPTPVLYFATHHLGTGSGVMITGSHNPSNYNGLKMMVGGETFAGDAIQDLLTRIKTGNFRQGQGSLSREDVQQAYLDRILGDIAVAAPLKVVVDAGNGIAGELGPRLIEELGCEVIPLYCEVDGSFPNHHPDPGKPENLVDLIARVKSEKADLGIAFDGDGDRLGVVTNTGKIIWADRLLMLFARDVVSRNPGADIIYDVKCSRRLAATINEFGGRPIMWKTGHSWIKAKMKETGALLAGEMSGHVFFSERWLGFDDGIYSAARLLEILGIEDRTSDEVFADFPEDVSTPEINLTVTDENKFEIIKKLASEGEFGDANINTIDGVRVDYADGWGLCRASNTTPMLVLRFEAENEESLERIKVIFREQMEKIAPDVELTF